MRIIVVLLLILLSGFVQAQVYRSVGKDGSVIYSDQPTDGSVKVEVKELETIKSLESPPLPTETKKPAQPKYYSDLTITSPGNDQAIRDNAGSVNVTVSVAPGLRSSHKLVLYLDGKEYSKGNSTMFKLDNVDRGTHQLRVAVLDANGRQLIDSKSVSFHMLRYSALQAKPKSSQPPKAK